MQKKKKYTDEQIKEALIYAHGFYTVAARYLEADHHNIKDRILKSPELKRLWEGYKEIRIEEAEFRLFSLIKGELRTSLTCVPALIFFLRTQGKEKGYGQEEIKVMNESYVKSFLEFHKNEYFKLQHSDKTKNKSTP